MKRFLFLLCFCALGLGLSAQKKLNFGAGIQILDFDYFGFQGKAMYNYNESLDFGGTFTFYLDDVVDFGIDLDAHYKLLTISDNFNFRPMAGINILRASFMGNGDTDLGLNVGAMFDFVIDSYRIYAEPKLIITEGTPLVISAGILF